MRRWLVSYVVSVSVMCSSVASAQFVRTAPDIKTPDNYQPGTGVNRLGIKVRPSPLRNSSTFAVPNRGYYYYGWAPGGTYFYDGYYANRYLCGFCGRRWCRGGCGYYYSFPLPLVAANPGEFFGPRPVQQVMGLDANANNNPGVAANPVVVAQAQAPAVPPKLSNPTVRARAWKFVEYGDRHFKKGNYRKAAERYRKAESQAPDIPDVYFRQGFAELGVGRYAEAVVAMQEGLELNPDWPNSGFVLEELYPSPEAKRDVFRELHAHLEDHPHDADALYLLSVLRHFDGQAEAAEVGFRRVVQLTGLGHHAQPFLPPAREPQKAPQPEEAKGPLLPQ